MNIEKHSPKYNYNYGNISFDGDSLPDFSEFDSDSVIDEYHRER